MYLQYLQSSQLTVLYLYPNNVNLPKNTNAAISTMTMFSDTPVMIIDTSISTGSLQFTVSALVFHKISGEPFSVTYTVDAVARTLNH